MLIYGALTRSLHPRFVNLYLIDCHPPPPDPKMLPDIPKSCRGGAFGVSDGAEFGARPYAAIND